MAKTRIGELEAVNKELEAFTYSVSHDLRSPLRIINGYGKMLSKYDADRLSKEGKESLDVILANAKQMGRLIDDLLDFSRLGRASLAQNPVDMNDMVSNT